jgi:phosphoglycolate phosphatase-like HAD superfamily hydrolase
MGRNQEFGTGRGQPRKTAVIFDMDGTLADVSSIRHHVEGPKKNFRAFHEDSVNVPPNPDVLQMAHDAKQSGHDVIVVTARDAEYKPHTTWWLSEHEVPHDALYMRNRGDRRPDYEVKKDILGHIAKHWEPVHAVDDNPNVLKLWHENGISTTRVPGWPEK